MGGIVVHEWEGFLSFLFFSLCFVLRLHGLLLDLSYFKQNRTTKNKEKKGKDTMLTTNCGRKYNRC